MDERKELVSIRKLSNILSVPTDTLKEVSYDVASHYRPYYKKKSSGKRRKIHRPTGVLKHIQNRIYERILSRWLYDKHLHGGIKKRSTETFARNHIGKQLLITIDFQDFFPSIDSKRVYYVWNQIFNYGREVSALLMRLTTVENQLPHGAPTSTALANLAVFDVDSALIPLFEESGLKVDRYVDDIAISGKGNPKEIVDTTCKILLKCGFRISWEKLLVMSSGKRQSITGLVVNRKLSLPREQQSAYRKAVHDLEIYLKQEQLEKQKKMIRSVRGKLYYLRNFHPRKAEKLLARVKQVEAALKSEE